MAKIGIVGDLHGNPLQLNKWIELAKVDAVLQVGDFGCYEAQFAVPVYWTYGNKEYVPEIKKRKQLTADNGVISKACLANNNFMLQDGAVNVLFGLNVGALGGAEGPKGDGYIKPYPKEVPESFIENKLDIFISHEPVTSRIETSIFDGRVLNTANDNLRNLVKQFKPKFVFSGHWHIDANEEFDGIDSYIIGLNSRNWLIFDIDKYMDECYPISCLTAKDFI